MLKREHDPPGPRARPPVGHDGGRQRGLAPRTLALQRVVGNRGVAQVVAARRPTEAQVKSTDPSTDPPIDESTDPGIDFDIASYTITDWARFQGDVLSLHDGAMTNAILQYEKYAEIKEVPELSQAIAMNILGATVNLIPGGAVVKAGIATGIFVHDSLRSDLARDDKLVEKSFEFGKGLGEDIAKSREKVKEAEKAADEAEERAKDITKIGNMRLRTWEEAIAKLELQVKAARKWLLEALKAGRHAGGLNALVTEHLGPTLKLDGKVTPKLAEAYELELYREKFGALFYYQHPLKVGWAGSPIVVGVESYFTTGAEWETQAFKTSKFKRDSSLTPGLRRRIALLAGRPAAADDDHAIVEILGMATMSDAEDRD